ncbi:Desosaminyl transferase EryCIII precursor [Streptomyces sp. YIM 130001]|uniref:activator-dependent family glycosyltransferase n=1 Tax=Streptomyces sp. YIM 130001 TaxID=2259644 RepID=UPI000E64E413|nr:activator-dependent family glycosyltransferase [Streptomyces sp. YIM 130001]RII07940.1 Desosaminyl transferase EryCIII precursor [Streptomyces sp. YIM 130001]
MRVLFVTSLNRSQLYLMAPLAWAMQTAGHQVRLASHPELAQDIAGLGLLPVPIGKSSAHLKEELADAEPEKEPEEAAGTALGRRQLGAKPVQSDYGWDDPHAELVSMAEDFFPLLTPDATFDGLVTYARHWQPDLVVWNSISFAGPVAARACGAAHARLMFGVDALVQLRNGVAAAQRASGQSLRDPMRDWLEPVLRRYDCTFDEEMVVGQWTIDPAPSWIHHPQEVSYVPVRPVSFNGPVTSPAWVDELPARRRVCLTLGFSHRESHGIEAPAGELLEAVADIDAEVIATFSRDQISPDITVPDNVRVVDFVPLNTLLPNCSAIVHHGGPGTFVSAIEHGVPQLIVPGTYWHEKWWGPVAHANGLESRGAGVYVADSDQVTAELLRKEVIRVLDDPSFSQNADRVRNERLGTPGPNEVIPLLEKLTRRHRAART